MFKAWKAYTFYALKFAQFVFKNCTFRFADYNRIFLNKFTKNFHNFFWIYGVFIYFCFEMKMFLFHFKIMCAENVVITKVIGFS